MYFVVKYTNWCEKNLLKLLYIGPIIDREIWRISLKFDKGIWGLKNVTTKNIFA